MADLAPQIDHQAALRELRNAVARLERGPVVTEGETISLCPPIDRLLPAGGLARGAFHQDWLRTPAPPWPLARLSSARQRDRSSGLARSRTSGLQVLRSLVSRRGISFSLPPSAPR